MSLENKAGFLLFLFSLKAITGFTCPVVFDINYRNIIHHPGTELMAHEKSCHYQDKSGKHPTSKECKINCGSYRFKEFTKIDKSTLWIYSVNVIHTSKGPVNMRYFVQSHRLFIADIRIAMRSLQI